MFHSHNNKSHVTQSLSLLTEKLKIQYNTENIRVTKYNKIRKRGINDIYRGNYFVDGKGHRYYLKFYHSLQAFDNEFAMLNFLYDKLSSLDDIGVIKPICSFPQTQCVVTEEFPGVNLKEVIRSHAMIPLFWRSRPLLQELVRLYAKALIAYQYITAGKIDTISEFDSLAIGAEIAKRIKYLRDKRIINGAESEIITQKFTERLQRVQGTHNHLCAYDSDVGIGNALTDYRKVVLIDFEDYKEDNAHYNIAAAYLSLHYLTKHPFINKKLIHELLDVFMREMQTSYFFSEDQFSFFLMLSMLRRLSWQVNIQHDHLKRKLRDVIFFKTRMCYYVDLLLQRKESNLDGR